MRCLFVLAGVFGVLLLPAVASAEPTIVSLTFDDATANHSVARSILAENGIRATFYVNTNKLGTSSFLTWEEVSAVASDGNEITGHTLDHIDLTTVSTAEATRQVCDDRQALVSRGFGAVNFAYPYGAHNSSVESIVQACGYQAARRAWGLCNIGLMPPNCNGPVAEPIPARNTWAIASAGVRAYHTLGDLQGAVTRAEDGGGGWVVLLIHNVCDGCSENGYSVSPTTLSAFAGWLAARSSSGTYVRRMSDVVGDHTAPTSSIACNGGACSRWFAQSVSVSLEAADSGTAVSTIRYTTDGSTPTTSSPLYTGPFNVSTTTTVSYRAWDMAGNVETTKNQLIQVDTAAPASSITCNDSVCSSGTYTSPVSVALSATDSGGSGVAEIHYETNGSEPTLLSPRYFAAFTVSTTTTVAYRTWDNAGNVEATRTQLIEIGTAPTDTTPPTSAIACNGGACSSGWYASPVSVSLSATDAAGTVAAIRYTTDGSEPSTSSTLYTGPFGVSTSTTVRYRAWDNAGNAEATKSQLIQIDTVAPSINITSPANGATVGAANVKIIAAASDAPSGVASVAFYADGVLVATATSSPWQTPWNTKKAKAGQHVLTAVARDRAGNSTTSAAVTVTVR